MDRSYSYTFERGEKLTFHIWDYVVFGATLVASASIGLFYAIKDRKKTNAEEFLLGGRQLTVLPVTLSLLSSFISAITLLGTPAEVYTYNTMYWWISVGFVISATSAAHIFIPVFMRLGITSIFEYIDLRFGRIVRFVASIIYLLWMLLYMAIVLYGPSLALSAVSGLNLWGSVVAVGLVCTFYTTLGGMKAVVWTDTLQMLIMFAGMLTLLIAGSVKIGGLGKAWDIANKNGRIVFFEFNPDPTIRHTVWTVGVGGGIFWSAIYGINQAQVQRAISLPSIKKMRLAIWLNFPGMAIVLSLVCSVGVVMYAYFSTCDPVSAKQIDKTDQLIPIFTMDLLGHLHGLPGLIMSCVFSGSLSTISSGLNAVAAVILKDFVKPFCFKNATSFQDTIFSKIVVIAIGVICLLLAYVVSELGAILQLAYVLFGILGGPLLGLFSLGVLFPWANKWGGLTGLLSSLALLLWIGLGTRFEQVVVSPPSPLTTDGCRMNFTDIATTTMTTLVSTVATTTPDLVEKPEPLAIYKMSYMWYAGLATLTTVVVGLLVSFVTGYTRPKEIDPRLICPIFDELCPYLPEKVRKPLRFGVRHGEDEFGEGKKKVSNDFSENKIEGIDNKALDLDDVKFQHINGALSDSSEKTNTRLQNGNPELHNSQNSSMLTKL